MSVQIKLKSRKTTTNLLESSSAASAVSTEEENFMDDVEPAASSALSEQRSTAMKMLLEVIALFCCIYDANFKKLVKECKLGAREGKNGNGDFFLVDLFYNE